MQDAYILARLLALPDVTREKLATVLRVYDEVRRPFSQGVLKGSDRNGATYQMRREGSGWENLSAEDSKAGRYPREWLAAIAEECGLLPPNQFGARPGRRTTDAALLLTQYIQDVWRQGGVVTVLYLDIK